MMTIEQLMDWFGLALCLLAIVYVALFLYGSFERSGQARKDRTAWLLVPSARSRHFMAWLFLLFVWLLLFSLGDVRAGRPIGAPCAPLGPVRTALFAIAALVFVLSAGAYLVALIKRLQRTPIMPTPDAPPTESEWRGVLLSGRVVLCLSAAMAIALVAAAWRLQHRGDTRDAIFFFVLAAMAAAIFVGLSQRLLPFRAAISSPASVAGAIMIARGADDSDALPDDWQQWATAWLDGSDRSIEAAARAAHAVATTPDNARQAVEFAAALGATAHATLTRRQPPSVTITAEHLFRTIAEVTKHAAEALAAADGSANAEAAWLATRAPSARAAQLADQLFRAIETSGKARVPNSTWWLIAWAVVGAALFAVLLLRVL